MKTTTDTFDSLRSKIDLLTVQNKTLKENEKNLLTMLQKIPKPFQSLDINGNILNINDKWCNELGYSKTEVLGKNFSAFLALESKNKYIENFQKFKSRGYTSDVEFQMLRKDGREISISLDGTIIYDDQDKVLHTNCVFTNITKEKEIALSLYKSEKKFRDLYDKSPDMYVSVSPIDATVLLCNNTLLKKTQYTKEEIIGFSVFNLYHEDALEDAKKTFKLFIDTGSVVDFPLILKKKDGSKIQVDLNVNVIRDKEENIMYSISSYRDTSKIHKVEHKYHDLLTNMEIGVVIHNADSSVKYINPFAKKILGTNLETMLHMDFKETNSIFLDVDGDVLAVEDFPINKIIREQKPFKDMVGGVKNEDNIKWVLASGYPVYDNNKLLEIVINFSDITARRNVELDMQNSKKKIQSILDASPIGIGMVVDRILKDVNDYFCKMIGFSKDELNDKSSRILYDTEEEFLRVGKEKYNQITFEGLGIVETKFKKKNGDMIDVILSSSPLDTKNLSLGVIFTVLDITDIKKNKFTLQETTNKLKRAQKIAQLGNWSYQISDGSIEWSEEMYHIYGHNKSNKEMTLELFTSWLHPDDRKIQSNYMNNMLKMTQIDFIEPFSYRVVHEDKSIHWIEITVEAEYDENDEIKAFFGTAQDITQKKENEAKIAQTNKLMIDQSRHAAMGEMISMIAHQWRQPLAVIAMNINNILLDIALDTLTTEETKNYSNNIMLQTEHLSETIDDFRNFFKPDVSTSEITIKEVMAKSYNILKDSLANNNITFTTSYESDAKVIAYPRELMQVFINIITNSKDALLEKKVNNGYIKVNVYENNKYIVTEISDNGGGINENILPKIFDPYFSTKNELSGTGLGLYMSKMIVEDHLDGKIDVINNDVGACFKIKLKKLK